MSRCYLAARAATVFDFNLYFALFNICKYSNNFAT